MGGVMKKYLLTVLLLFSGSIPVYAIDAFSGHLSSDQALTLGAWDLIVFDTEDYDTGGFFNPANGVFTAVTNSLWYFEANVTVPRSQLGWWKNGSPLGYVRQYDHTSGWSRSRMIYVQTGDIVSFRVNAELAGSAIAYGSFTGTRIDFEIPSSTGGTNIYYASTNEVDMGDHVTTTNELGYLVYSNLVDAVNAGNQVNRDIRVGLMWLLGGVLACVVLYFWPGRRSIQS